MKAMHTTNNEKTVNSTLAGLAVGVIVALVAFLLSFLYVQATLAAIPYSVTPVLF